MRIELIYDSDCPWVGETRRHLTDALKGAEHPVEWHEWERNASDGSVRGKTSVTGEPGCPYSCESDLAKRIAGYGSPTVLINDRDITGEGVEGASACCRLYRSSEGTFQGAPPVELIGRAVDEASGARGNRDGNHGAHRGVGDRSSWWASLAVVPGAGAALLLMGACPACWPAYAGLLGAVGLGFVLNSAYLLPLTLAFLGLVLLGLARGARSRRGYGPFTIGLVAAMTIVAGKFVLGYPVLTYSGVAVLLAASLWNAWPVGSKRDPTAGCGKCTTGESAPIHPIQLK